MTACSESSSIFPIFKILTTFNFWTLSPAQQTALAVFLQIQQAEQAAVDAIRIAQYSAVNAISQANALAYNKIGDFSVTAMNAYNLAAQTAANVSFTFYKFSLNFQLE